jgi:hypothetical protein
MSHWHDTMVDRPETDGAVYVTGWTISGLAVLGAIVAVWILLARLKREVAKLKAERDILKKPRRLNIG